MTWPAPPRLHRMYPPMRYSWPPPDLATRCTHPDTPSSLEAWPARHCPRCGTRLWYPERVD